MVVHVVGGVATRHAAPCQSYSLGDYYHMVEKMASEIREKLGKDRISTGILEYQMTTCNGSVDWS